MSLGAGSLHGEINKPLRVKTEQSWNIQAEAAEACWGYAKVYSKAIVEFVRKAIVVKAMIYNI